jgi:RNA polymerase sigma-70 factor (ECF subfamily)
MDPADLERAELPLIVERLMRRHGRMWLRFVQRMLQNQADAEDVLQDAILKMLARGRHFASPDQARMYLGRIISNTAIELYHMRKRLRMQQLPLQEQMHQAMPRDDPAYPLSEKEERRIREQVLHLLAEGLARLPMKQYEALRMTIMDPEPLSIRDAGVELDVPYSTLRHRKLQGLRRLKKFLMRALRRPPARFLMA